MLEYELILCFSDRTWTTDYVEHPEHISEEDVHENYLENYESNMKEGDRDIAYLGTYNIEDVGEEV